MKIDIKFFTQKNIIILFLISLVLFFALFYILKINESHKVRLTEKGFSPTTLSINVGDSVEFINEIDRPFWPASDSHPDHTIYPEFDSKKPISPNGKWKFKFDKEGIWGFHDHLFHTFQGVIIVGEINETSINCDKDGANNKCWRTLLLITLKKDGIDKSLNLLEELYKIEPAFASYCHDAAHEIGRSAYDIYREKGIIDLTNKASYCGYGFYHGVMEKLLSVSGDPREAGELCARIANNASRMEVESGCFHGLGHAALALSVSEISSGSQRMIDRAVLMCRQAGIQERYIQSCYSGLFMELSTYYTSGIYNLTFDISKPLAICHAQQNDIKSKCFEQMYGVLGVASEGDILTATKFLYEIEDNDTLNYSVENFVSSVTDNASRNKNLESCRIIRSDLLRPCIRGIVLSIMLYGTPGSEQEEAMRFCNSDILMAEEKIICTKAMETFYN